MTRFIALLRGINVGGHNKLPMAELRSSLEAAGFSDVETYIQSGNVALTGPRCTPDEISGIIKQDFDLEIPVVVRSERQLKATIKANPFPELVAEPKRLLVYFCPAKIPKNAMATFDHEKYLPDRLALGPSEIYVGYDEAMSKSKLTNPVLDRALDMATTARNWNTVLKLAEMAAG